MAVSLSTSYTVATRQALSTSLNEAAMAATKMSTGENITHAYEDPTGLAIGSNMRSQLDVLNVVKTGIDQSQSMLYIAEAGLQAIHNTYSQLNQVLAKAKLGYMTDDLVEKTLSPTYNQLKAEMNRIADSVDFNGQKLFNATGGKITKGTVSTLNTSNAQYIFADASELSLGGFALTGIEASVNGAAAAAVTITSGSVSILSGSITYTGSDTVSIKGATIFIKGADIDDGTNGCNADCVLSNVDINISNVTYDPATQILSTTTAPTFTTTNASVTFNSVVPVGASGITSLTNGAIPTIGTPLVATSASIDNVSKIIPLIGGKNSFSAFQFVTGTDLNRSIVEVSFPNLRLTSANNIPGIISTINVPNNTATAAPTGLTSLLSIADANTDIPLVAQLLSEVVEYLDALGAYQQRFLNISEQLGTSVEQLNLAQGAIMNADLAEQSEKFARDNVKVQVAISVIGQMTQSMQALQRLVQ